jgi:hypothetical protein
MNAGASADSATERNGSDSARRFKTTVEDTLQFQSNTHSALTALTLVVNGSLEEV